MPVESGCIICAVLTSNRCSNCNQAYYCTTQHQKLDWKSHKSICYPFKIEENLDLGRFLLTTRNITPFEIILKEAPIVRGPSQITGAVCLGCLNGIDPINYINCQKCGWPLCGTGCSESYEHKHECELTAKRGFKVNIKEFTIPHPMYQCITTLRCLLLKMYDTNKWNNFASLESLNDIRQGSVQWKADLESIGKFIPKFFNTKEFTEDEVMEAVGVLQINGHEVPSTDPPHVAVFQYASLLEHSCRPNLAKSFTADGHIMLWAPKAIKKNSHISICYCDALWGTADRRNHLMQTKLFRCCCLRCLDVTEYDTNYSVLKCTEQNCMGVLQPINPNEWHGKCRCKICNTDFGKLYIRNCLEKSGRDLHAMVTTVDNCFKYINHYTKILSKNHFHITEVKIKLVQQIGRDPKELMIVPDEQLNIKIKYGAELINLLETLAPCETRILGILCFELHSAYAEYTRRMSLKASISRKNLLQEVENSLKYVEKSINLLQHEADIYAEGLILKQAKINRDTLKSALKI